MKKSASPFRVGFLGLSLALFLSTTAFAQTNYYPYRFSPLCIVSPPNRAVFYAPVDIPIFAYARDLMGAVTNVTFYANGQELGEGKRLHIPTPISPLPTFAFARDQFFLVWSNAPVGPFALTAVGQDLRGHSTTSAPVNITVVASSPPGTNLPDVVSIIATDPIAIEGTNCWVWRGVTNGTPTWTNRLLWGLITNCGPKNATFAVRRFGDCSSDLTVHYTTSGNATNGIQYVALPGSVTIPAGQAYTLITLVPIDDGRPDVNRVAILNLIPSASAPPDYRVGIPRGAAALIIDSSGPRPTTGMVAGTAFHVNTAGPDGAWFHIEYSTDMVNWTPICMNQVVGGAIDFVDPEAQTDAARYYRAVPEPAAPTQ
jgi:hypothetical protein